MELFENVTKCKTIDGLVGVFGLEEKLERMREKVPVFDEFIKGVYYNNKAKHKKAKMSEVEAEKKLD